MRDEELFVDTSVFSNFASIEKLDLLWKFSNNIFTTREVISEIERGIWKKPQLSSIIEAQEKGKIEIVSSFNEGTFLLMDKLRSEGILGKGEISLIGISKERDAIFVSDDKQATNKAKVLGIKILSNKDYRDTVIILKKLLKNGKIDENEYRSIQKMLKENNFIFN